MSSSAHIDTFAHDHLPPVEQQPEFLFDRPELNFPERLNCAARLLDRWVAEAAGDRLCLRGEGIRWTYADLQAHANRIARVLVDDMGLVPGNRVMLRGANCPMLAACWLAVMKAGGIAVTTMPLLRPRELTAIIEKAQISHALCDLRRCDDLIAARPRSPALQTIVYYHSDADDGLEARASRRSPEFENVDTAADDVCLIAFTSGTTGAPKATMHFHGDVMSACRCWPPHILQASDDDVFIGSPPLAFTFGLGGLLLFPLSIAASSVLLEVTTPDALLDGIERY